MWASSPTDSRDPMPVHWPVITAHCPNCAVRSRTNESRRLSPNSR
jgi:hypothetical protein